MKSVKKVLALVSAVAMLASMTACGEEDESSKEVSSRTSDSEVESKSDTTTTTTTTAESSMPTESETDSEWQEVKTTDFTFETLASLDETPNSTSGELLYNVLGEADNNIQLLSTNYVREYYDNSIEYSLGDTTDWLNNSKVAILEVYGGTLNFREINNEDKSIDPNIEAMVIENEEEVEINGRKFIKCSGYIDSVEREDYDEANPFKCMFVGYLTVYQSENTGFGFKEPDLCSFFAFMKEDIADIEYMDKVALHAAETLKFEDE